MTEKDYVHAIYIVGIILIFAPIVMGALFLISHFDTSSTAADRSYAVNLSMTAGFMMIFYVAYKRFVEGWKSGRAKSDAIK